MMDVEHYFSDESAPPPLEAFESYI